MTSRDIYAKLNIVMFDPAGDKINMRLTRTWKRNGNQFTGSARISWFKCTSEEMSIFTDPEGYGDGKPTLIETLRQTATSADQESYLATYAEDRSKTLEADFHDQGEQLNAAYTESSKRRKEIEKLIGAIHIEEVKTTQIAKRLADA
ncbi:hypothetical protein H9Q70_007360 [Fusarium xylarioides]|nr:hypothetical protein H9Q70_007360 [Fusarium xylarioides]KAG5778425.1 hypothetical protein H9Q73_007892 [Fusarium xylarioides]KAG5803505.1 hypothetical protein H9Q71_011905 [Fusarium xylarioides]KAG5812470.1 hypothetical protein H9Q74_013109 [Fusarium xylarioides]